MCRCLDLKRSAAHLLPPQATKPSWAQNYDNLKSAVLGRHGDIIRFNPKLVELAGVLSLRGATRGSSGGNEKGRVERAIQYVRSSFFSARTYADLADLNRQALEWMTTLSADRVQW